MKALVLAFALAIVACGGGGGSAPTTHRVAIKGMQFVPAKLSVKPGDTVIWTNEDILPHTVTSASPWFAAFDSKDVGAKATWQWTVAVTKADADNVDYVCTYHPTMQGRLVITR